MKSNIRKIPATMVTQHPDHAYKPYWLSDAFVSTRDESEECFRSYSELNATEYKWDWEGKLVDESVLERLYSDHYDYFKRYPLGKEKFLTFRLPNPKVETEFRLGRAFMSISSAASLAKQLGVHTPPLFEVILPMTESESEMIDIQEAYDELYNLKHVLYRFDKSLLEFLEIIPLFEQVQTIIHSHEILRAYLSKHQKRFKRNLPYVRPYVARSDPALNSGLVPTVLAIKIALSHYSELEEELGIDLFPIIGAASLPFRGGISPLTVKQFAKEYSGIRTTTLQSSFRYDYDIDDVKEAIRELETILPKGKAKRVSKADEKTIQEIIPFFESAYKRSVEQLATSINDVASHLPRRRERVQHVGLFGYSRGVGKVKLPRAIGFTAALYSLGIPPEIIGTGRGVRQAKNAKKLGAVEQYYLHLKQDLARAGRFLHKDLLRKRARSSQAWNDILEDVEYIERHFDMSFEPHTDEEKAHQTLVASISKRLADSLPIHEFIEEAARMRKSLG